MGSQQAGPPLFQESSPDRACTAQHIERRVTLSALTHSPVPSQVGRGGGAGILVNSLFNVGVCNDGWCPVSRCRRRTHCPAQLLVADDAGGSEANTSETAPISFFILFLLFVVAFYLFIFCLVLKRRDVVCLCNKQIVFEQKMFSMKKKGKRKTALLKPVKIF